ncbi:TlpA disulfide reductase family protein [Winogradskyella sp. PG-2]|uniref:TlpA disulfide reductase family protein n=1 Tax=Winogradskyella sp. PG-2 TaxID=754409 RepID=UPI0004587C17|nr:TlpA disulfide reductase family protein [Winogradskyella sp. PG-2]BAO77080.1 disulfide interchange protein [Winogradskyella sp. PG-2]
MKRIFTIIIVGLLIVSCKKENRTDFVINGTAPGVYNGVRIYLKYIDEKGKEIVSDTAIVFDEKFNMDGKVEEPTMHFISVNSVDGNAMLMLENSEIDIEINKQNLMESKVTGSESNEGFIAFQDGMNKIREEGQGVMTAYRQLKLPEEAAKKDSLTKEIEKLGLRLTGHPLNFILENNDSYFSLNLIGLEANKPKLDVPGFMKAFENLTPRLKETKKGKEVKKRLDELFVEYEKIAHLEIGKVAPNFEAPKPDGTLVSLNDLKGKVTIIDFWAAWCGPCRRENPNVVRIYEKYHDQGLEIIGISLDGERRQQDPKKAWLDAIANDKLTWTQLSHLKYFDDPVAKLYNISAIPATFILDKDGKIAYKNLRGKALELKVEELLAQ